MSASSTPTSDNVSLMVALRIRPLTSEERLKGATQAALKVDDKMVVLLDPGEKLDDVLRQKRSREKRFLFDVAFGPESTQKDVYIQTTQPLIDSVVNGYNATVFAYGATGAGKTFTMLGNEKNLGMMPRTLNDLFIRIQQNKNEYVYDVKMSYLEIYNEMIRDLLTPSSEILDLREDSKGFVQVAGLSEIRATSSADVLNLLMQGNTRRTQEPTLANKTSSRSHAVCQVTVTQSQKLRDVQGMKRIGRLFLIDLAGSERAAHTQNTGIRLKEGAHINRSLLALGNVINTLAERGGRFVNYRDSKLTRLLKDSLGGNSRTVMIANISPASNQFEESRNTLIYADRAKNITTKLTKNTQDVTYHVTQYQSIISELRKEIVRLKSKIDEQNGLPVNNMIRSESAQSFYVSPPKEIMASSVSLPPIKQSQEFFQLRDEFILLFQEQMKLRHQLMELNDKAYDLAYQIAKSEAEFQSVNQNIDGTGASVIQDQQHLAANVENMKKRLADFEHKRGELEYDLQINRKSRKKLEDNMAHTVGNSEQREIWSLLFRLHEVEVDKTVLQSDAMLLSRRLDRQESSLRKVTDFRNVGDMLITEQQKVLTDGGVSLNDRAKQLYHTYKTSKNKLDVAQKTRAAETYAKISWNRANVDQERHPRQLRKNFDKTMTSDELKSLKRSNNSLQKSDSFNSVENLPVVKPKIKVNGTTKPSPKDDIVVNYNNSGSSPSLDKIKSKANEKRTGAVGWKSPLDDRPTSGSSSDPNKPKNNDSTEGKKKPPNKNHRSKVEQSLSLPSSRRNSLSDLDKQGQHSDITPKHLPILPKDNNSNLTQTTKPSKIPAGHLRNLPNPNRRVRSPTQSNLPHISHK